MIPESNAGRATLAVAVTVAFAGGGMLVKNLSERELHNTVDPSADTVVLTAQRIVALLGERCDLEATARDGQQAGIPALDPDRPNPPVVTNGKTIGREVPPFVKVPILAEASTLAAIRRDSRELTPKEAAAFARKNDTTVGVAMGSTVGVRGEILRRGIVSANGRQYRVYQRLVESVAKAAQQSLDPLDDEIAQAGLDLRGNLKAYKEVAGEPGSQITLPLDTDITVSQKAADRVSDALAEKKNAATC